MASETTSLSERFGGLTPRFSEKAGRLASRPFMGGEGRTPRPPASLSARRREREGHHGPRHGTATPFVAHSFPHSLFNSSLTDAFLHSFAWAFIHSFSQKFTHSHPCLKTHAFTRSFIHSPKHSLVELPLIPLLLGALVGQTCITQLPSAGRCVG